MSQILKCLVASEDKETIQHLKKIMLNKWDIYSPAFTECTAAGLKDFAEPYDLLFIDNNGGNQSAATLITLAAGHACIVLDEEVGHRAALLAAGADEVMSLADLQSDTGVHLIEKVIALKKLAIAEKRAEQSEERFREIIEHSHDMIILLAANGVVSYVSPAFERQMDYTRAEMIGTSFFSIVHAEDLETLYASLKDIVQDSVLPGISAGAGVGARIRRKDGVWRHIEARATNLLAQPNVRAIVLNCRDITPQKKAERELENYRRQLEEMVARRTAELETARTRLETFMSTSPDTLIVIDRDGYISYASEHYLHRYPRDVEMFKPGVHILDAFEVIARNIPLSTDDPRYADMRRWWETPEGTREFRHAGGVWTRLQARRIEATGEIVIVTTDITDYKRQQSQLAAQSAELQAALMSERELAEQQKTFVSMVSHEFRTPLSIIDGSAQIILNRGSQLPKEMLEKRASTIRGAVERLIRLIETILSTHMLETGRISLETAPCDLSKLLRDICRDQQDISPDHAITLETEGLPPQQMLDGKLVRQIFTNLLSNAVKYSPGRPEIRVRAVMEAAVVRVDVQDNGLGIPEQEQPKIFAKYFRASTSGGIPGSGLGLTLVKQFVDMHQGEISMKSQVDVGTTMTVRLPVIEAITLE